MTFYVTNQDSRPIPLPNKAKDDILLFFKLYDPEKEEIRYYCSSYSSVFICFYVQHIQKTKELDISKR